MIFQTEITWSNRIHSLKYLRYATFSSQDIVIRKSRVCGKDSIPLLSRSRIERIWAAAWILDTAQIWLVPLKIVFNVLRFKPVLNWNRFLADLRRGSKSLNSDSVSTYNANQPFNQPISTQSVDFRIIFSVYVTYHFQYPLCWWAWHIKC